MDSSLLGCDVLRSYTWLLAFRRTLIASILRAKVNTVAILSFDTFVTTCQTPRSYNLDDLSPKVRYVTNGNVCEMGVGGGGGGGGENP